MHFAVFGKCLAQATMAHGPIYDHDDIGTQTIFVAQPIPNARKAIFQFINYLPDGLTGESNDCLAAGQVTH